MNELFRWERATPMALRGSVTDKMSAIGVARSQRKTLFLTHLHRILP